LCAQLQKMMKMSVNVAGMKCAGMQETSAFWGSKMYQKNMFRSSFPFAEKEACPSNQE